MIKLPGGLRITAPDPAKAARAVALSVVGVAGFAVLIDAVIFRASLPGYYTAYYTGPLIPRMFEMSLLGCIEELKFRLLLMTALVALAALVCRRRPPAAWFVAIIALAQLAKVYPLVLADPLHGALRFWLPGCVWGWLYWRHGWVAALVAHGAVHWVMDPALFLALR